MSYRFLLASGNPHKAEEFGVLFDPSVVAVEAAAKKIAVEETGTTFLQNALIKAKSYYDEFKQPTLADDSGLVVNALPEEMGVTSARFGGEGLSDKERAELLLSKMENKKGIDRSAYFVCVLAFYISDEEIFFFEGRMDGEVALDYRGKDGFGYDPVFIPSHHDGSKTIAQLPQWKKQHSHRAQAARLAQTFFAQHNSKV